MISSILSRYSIRYQSTSTVRGWLRTRRSGKTVHFLEIVDGTSGRGVQCVVPRVETSENNPDLDIADAQVGCSLEAQGVWVDSKGSQQLKELQVSALRVVGKADPNVHLRLTSYLTHIRHIRCRKRDIRWSLCEKILI